MFLRVTSTVLQANRKMKRIICMRPWRSSRLRRQILFFGPRVQSSIEARKEFITVYLYFLKPARLNNSKGCSEWISVTSIIDMFFFYIGNFEKIFLISVRTHIWWPNNGTGGWASSKFRMYPTLMKIMSALTDLCICNQKDHISA